MTRVIIVENSIDDFKRYREPLTKRVTEFRFDKIIFFFKSLFSTGSWYKLFQLRGRDISRVSIK